MHAALTDVNALKDEAGRHKTACLLSGQNPKLPRSKPSDTPAKFRSCLEFRFGLHDLQVPRQPADTQEFVNHL